MHQRAEPRELTPSLNVERMKQKVEIMKQHTVEINIYISLGFEAFSRR